MAGAAILEVSSPSMPDKPLGKMANLIEEDSGHN
jgi:hypothetical protein